MTSSAALPGAGRADRLRAFLRANPRAYTARELVDALEPGIRVDNMLGSLNTLVKSGELVRVMHAGRPHFADRELAVAAAATPRVAPIAPPALSQPAQAPAAPEPRTDASSRPPTASARIRGWLQQAAGPVTSRQVQRAVLPDTDIRVVSGLIASMVRKGLVVRTGTQGLEGLYALGRQARAWGFPPNARAPKAPKAAKPPAAPKPPNQPKPKPERPAKAAKAPKPTPRLVHGPAARERDVPRGLASIERPARRSVAACALDGIPDAARAASERLSADIAAFEAAGGRIERLGPTQFFKHIGMEAANTFPPRTPRTGTYDLDD
ncbi:hypothetical protein QF205_10795 [Luteimonas composti]|uniref:MarR family transcriptional regulator n=1 Tax=Luteimonas composti TaxID=398257 RepID=A0ABT6MT01_9GAMM|nr:hypothetical protein [Luteimonas composti]MDH7453549.1 hypothetical protein [Luteimonas composti]